MLRMVCTVIFISTGVLQIHWNVLSSFNEKESGEWPLGLSDFSFFDFIIIPSVVDCTQHFFIQQHDFLLSGLKETTLAAGSWSDHGRPWFDHGQSWSLTMVDHEMTIN